MTESCLEQEHGARLSSLQFKLARLDGARTGLQSLVERGGDLESDRAITLRSVFLHSFVELALELGGEHHLNGPLGTGGLAAPAIDAKLLVSP